MYIADPTTEEAELAELKSEVETLVASEGGTITLSEDMGRRQLAYRIKKFTEGYYFLFEIEGSGSEIAELERRLRVNDKVIRYLTVRVDEERKAAEKIVAKRAARKEKLKIALGNRGGNGEGEED
jgi:small subunit ribosomal protein S6